MENTLKDTGLEVHRAYNERPREFAIFGERGTGTGATVQLIRENLGLELTHEPGWKHGFPSMMAVSRRTLIVASFRNGIDWIKSLFNRPYHSSTDMQKLGFSEFLRHPWESEIDHQNWLRLRGVRHVGGNVLQADRHPITGEVFSNPLRMRSTKHAALLGLRNREVNYAFARHENLFTNPGQCLDLICNTFDLDREPELIYSPANVHTGKNEQKRKALIPDPLPISDLKFMADEMDREIEDKIGYTYPEFHPTDSGH